MTINLHHADNFKIMKTLSDESIDVICIDPPYLYLKNQKLERAFDEPKFFSECKRLLTKNGFIVMFGRGESFYRWNTMLSELGMFFKEEIVWDKSYTSSPVMNLSRVHENIVIFGNSNAGINASKIPYVEMKDDNYLSIKQDINRIKSALNNTTSLEHLLKYVDEKIIDYSQGKSSNFKTTLQSIRVEQDRSVKTIQAIDTGLREKSIIKVKRDHYKTIHPTQKPVRLLERLLKLVIPVKNKKIVVADWFGGSFSTGEAVINLQSEFPDKEFEFIGTEIDKEYFEAGRERIESINQPHLFTEACGNVK